MISFVQANIAENVGSSATSHSFTGNGLGSVSSTTNGIVFVWVESGGARNPTSVSWGGQAMTMLVGSLAISGRGWSSLWYRLAPASGAVTLSDTYSVSDAPVMVWALYDGVQQVAPEASGSNTTTTSSVTVTATTISNNAWLVGGATNNNGSASAGAGTTLRFSNVRSIGDSNGGKTPPGSYSLEFTRTGATGFSAGMAVIAPVSTSTANSNFFMLL